MATQNKKQRLIERYPKASWGPGPWVDEPDELRWVCDKTRLPCLMLRGPMGSWCGYVGVTRDHPLYGKRGPETRILDVHGGVTYVGGLDNNTWWYIGFDCAHAMDQRPVMDAFMADDPELKKMRDQWPHPIRDAINMMELYRDVDYVRDECSSLAAQLHDMVANVAGPTSA